MVGLRNKCMIRFINKFIFETESTYFRDLAINITLRPTHKQIYDSVLSTYFRDLVINISLGPSHKFISETYS
jgi:hypothetical protein